MICSYTTTFLMLGIEDTRFFSLVQPHTVGE